MKCGNCGREVGNGAAFCRFCGKKLTEQGTNRAWEHEISYRKRSMVEWKEKVTTAKIQRRCCEFRRENYGRVERGEYPSVKLYKRPQMKAISEKNSEKETGWSFQRISTLFAFGGIFTVFLTWFSIPLIAQYTDGATEKNIFGILATSIRILASDNWFVQELQEEFGGYLFLIVLFALAVLASAVLHVLYLIENFRNGEPQREAELKKRFDLCVKVEAGVSAGVFLVTVIANSALNAQLSDGYYTTLIANGAGTYLSLILSVAALIWMYVTGKGDEEKEKSTKYGWTFDVEVLNFDPTLLFRPVRLSINNGNVLKIGMYMYSFESLPIYNICADVVLIRSNGEELLIPEINFGAESKNHRMVGFRSSCSDELSDICAAKVFVLSYKQQQGDETGSGCSVESDYQALELRQKRQKEGDCIFMAEQEWDMLRMCSCGQIYEKTLEKCPLCGRKHMSCRGKADTNDGKRISGYN